MLCLTDTALLRDIQLARPVAYCRACGRELYGAADGVRLADGLFCPRCAGWRREVRA